ncbi:MAG: sensor histidine kinase [Deltaproteobacteria bacterium]
MRWPIRNQIFVPFVGVVLLAVAAMTAVAALLAARQRESQTLAQLQNVVETLAHTSVPYTEPVLQKMSGLSGAQFVACDARGGIVTTTLPEGTSLPAGFGAGVGRGELTSLASQPTVVLDDTRYFLARMEPRSDANVRALFVLYPVASWSRARWGAALPPLAVGAGAILLSSLASGWLAQRFSRRIRLLQQQVAAIAAGDFSEIVAGPRRDEIQELVVSVNAMSARLREMQHTIRQSERTRLLAQLAGGLAHQLRNAVTGARMALQLHQRRCEAASDDKSVSVALRQLALTETQVRGLLSLGRGERSQPAICDLSRIVEDVASLVEPTCDHAGVSLELERIWSGSTDAAGTVRADLESLRAAVLNLVTNAIEAAGPGGRVTLRMIRQEGMVGIEIGDNGQGPPAHVAETLFEPFVTSKPEGVGLGLALARQVAVDHGGTLAWHREGSRTMFRLMLPAAEDSTVVSLHSMTSGAKSEIRNPESEIARTHGTPPVGLARH